MEEIPKKKKIKLALIEGFFILLILLLAGVVYLLSYQKTYAGKIYPHVQFADINLGGQTTAEATKLLQNYDKKIDQQKITITNGTKSTEATFNDIGTTLDVQKMLNNAYETGRDSNFFKEIYASASTIYKSYSVDPIILTDQTKFSALVDRISSDLAEKATDSTISISGSTVSVSPSKKGLTINRDNLIVQITEIIKGQKSQTITAKTVYADPEVVESSFTNAKSQAEALMKKSATLQSDTESFQLSASQIGSLISFPKSSSGQITASIDSNKVASYVANTIAKKIDISKVDRKISQLNQSVISEGSNGRHVDRADTQSKVVNFLNSSATTTVITLSVVTDIFGDQIIFPDEGVVPGRFPGKYIDIDLTNQQLYLFDGTNQVAQYQVSTGKWSTPTPVGTRYIINKDPRAWSAPYGLYMPWWNGLGGGYGIHELPEWPGGKKEGENHLGTPVSHGCIRLGVGPAETVYNWADIGTPVYIHK